MKGFFDLYRNLSTFPANSEPEKRILSCLILFDNAFPVYNSKITTIFAAPLKAGPKACKV